MNSKLKTQNSKRSSGYEHDIERRAFEFAVRIVRLSQHLDELRGVGWSLSKQLVRSGTSVGANLEEAHSAHSRADFICKVEIALKEARETCYWLRLVVACDLLAPNRVAGLQEEAQEIARILAAIVVSTKSRKNTAPSS